MGTLLSKFKVLFLLYSETWTKRRKEKVLRNQKKLYVKMGDAEAEKKPYKIVILGGGGVGKSCLTFRLVHDSFVEKYDPTIEDSYRKDNFFVDGESVSIEILDTAGQDTYAGMRDLYYKSGDGFLMVYSVTDSSSLEDVKERYQSLLDSTSATPQTCKPVIFVGNKCDLDNDRVLSKEQGKAVADELGGGRIGHHESSAKNNINVTEVFQDIIRVIKVEDANKGKKGKKNSKGGGKSRCTII